MQLPTVDVRWRPSGGRGEFEHVPSNVLLDRLVVVDPLVLPGARIRTDVTGVKRSGKPRLRRAEPNNRSILNLPQLVAALALLPDPRRADQGSISLPLQPKGYLISSIRFRADLSHAGVAVCIPDRLQILHYPGEVDLLVRLKRVAALLTTQSVIPESARGVVSRYFKIIQSGVASAELRAIADELIDWISTDAIALDILDEPSEGFPLGGNSEISQVVHFNELGADETRRRLKNHFRIDRSKKLREAKLKWFDEKYGRIYCENCEFDFYKKFGERGRGFMEVHHKVPLAGLLPNTITYLDDLLLLCANCHRMVHRRQPDLTPDQLRAITVS